jgi:hypothetical protein
MNKAELGELRTMTVEELGWCARKVVSQQRVTCAWDGGLSSACYDDRTEMGQGMAQSGGQSPAQRAAGLSLKLRYQTPSKHL